jgi:CheY-like chemotaxis protein/two-component sensor histidine kinase
VGLANLMELATSESEKSEYLATIKSSCNMLLEIVNGVLDLSSIEAKKFHLVDEEFNLRVTIEEASKIFATAANDKRILLSELVDVNCPKFVTGDALRLKQILTNLISNAIKHTNIGSVRILVKKDDTSENSIKFSIQDTGLGISSEAQKELFKPYSQVSEHSIKAGGTGLGLVLVKELVEYMGGEINVESEPLKGCTFSFNIPFKSYRYDTPPRINLTGYQVLLISEFEMDHFLIKQIQNRSIDIVSQNILCQRDYELLEKSLQNNEYDAIVADFRLAPNHWMKSSNLVSYLKKIDKKILYLIPFGVNKIIPDEEHTISGPTHQSILYKHLAHLFGEQWKPSNTLLSKKSQLLSISALVVDDVELNRIVLSKFLESFGCQVEQAKSGNEALSLVKRKNIQIIFMDCVMPIMNGFETTKLLREYREFDSIPIIALTGDTSEETKELCTQVGMNGVITKPFSPEAVKDLIIKKCKIKFK